MKKLLLLFLLLSCMLLSCEKNVPKTVLGEKLLDENIRNEHPTMFYDENHEHELRYEYIPDSETISDYGISVYHRVYCRHENCEFEPYLEPHVIEKTVRFDIASMKYVEGFFPNNNPYVKENGLFYHSVDLNCAYCNGGSNKGGHAMKIWVLCQIQEAKCDGACLEHADWEEIVCNTPFEILSD